MVVHYFSTGEGIAHSHCALLVGTLSTRKTRTSFHLFSSTIVSDPGSSSTREYTKNQTPNKSGLNFW